LREALILSRPPPPRPSPSSVLRSPICPQDTLRPAHHALRQPTTDTGHSGHSVGHRHPPTDGRTTTTTAAAAADDDDDDDDEPITSRQWCG
jgi:hypothetical protein